MSYSSRFHQTPNQPALRRGQGSLHAAVWREYGSASRTYQDGGIPVQANDHTPHKIDCTRDIALGSQPRDQGICLFVSLSLQPPAL